MGRVTYRLTAIPHPFHDSGRVTREIPAGTPLSEALSGLFPVRWGGLAHWVVRVDGRRESVELVPPAGAIVTARLLPRDPVTASTLAASLAAAFAAPGALGAGLALGAAIVTTAAIVYFGSQGARIPAVASTGGSPPFYGISGTSNSVRQFEALQEHYGVVRVTPDLVMSPLTALQSDGKQTVRVLLQVGVGLYVLSDYRYGDQPLGNINPTVVEYLGEGSATTALGSDYSSNIYEEPLNLELRNEWTASTEFIRATKEGVTGWSMALVFPQGLWGLALHGDHVKIETRIVVRYRAVGDTTWISVTNELLKVYQQTPIARNYSVSSLTPDQYEISVQLKGTDKDYYTKDRGGSGSLVSVFVGDATWLCLRSHRPGAPFDADVIEGTTLVGVKATASELTGGTLSRISLGASRRLATYSTSPAGWEDDPTNFIETSNPAWALANEYRDAGVPDDELDSEEIARFAQYCEDEGWECNLSISSQTTLEQTLAIIAATGQGAPVMKGSLFSVTWDEPKVPIAVFTPGNLANFEMHFAVSPRCDAVRVRFPDAAHDFLLRETIVYLNGFTEETATEFETLDLAGAGITSESLARRFALRDYAKRRLRNVVYQWDADLSALPLSVGDCVLLNYAAGGLGSDGSTVVGYSTRDAGAHLDVVTVEPPVRMVSGMTYAAQVRTRGADGGAYSILAFDLVNPVTAGQELVSELEVSGDVDVPLVDGDPDTLEGQPIAVGEPTGLEVVLVGIERKQGLTSRLSAVALAPDLFTVDDEEAPA